MAYLDNNGVLYFWQKVKSYVSTAISGLSIPTKTSDLTNDCGLEEHPVTVTETDPTVPSWAKQPNKPTYTAAEVGALPDSYTPPVTSVNNKTGAVVLGASDVGALPANTPIPPTITVDSALSSSSENPVQNKVVTGALSEKYVKPSTGIQKTDLASDVQTSLGKADTAVQPSAISDMATETWVNQQGFLKQHQDISGKADKVLRVAMASTDTTPTLDPNKLYVFPEMSALTITLAAITDNSIVHEYHFIFESGATATTTTFPAIPGLDDFSAEANTVYEVSILEGRALVTSWEVSNA